jgi:flagellar hook-length control protein FliK
MQFFPGVQSKPVPFMNAPGVFEAAANNAGQDFSDVLCAHLEQPVSGRDPSPAEVQRPQDSENEPRAFGEDTAGARAEREAAEASPHGGAKSESVWQGEEQPQGRTDGGEGGRPEKAAADASVASEPEGEKEAVAAQSESEQVGSAGRIAGEGEELSEAAIEDELERVLDVASAAAKSQASQDVRARVEAKVEALREFLCQFRQSGPKERGELAVTLGERIRALKEELAAVVRQEAGSGAAEGEASVSRRASRAVSQLEFLSQRLDEAGKAAQAIAAASVREPKPSAGRTDAVSADAAKETRQSASVKKSDSGDVPEISGGAESIRTVGTQGKGNEESAPVAMQTAPREQAAAKQDASRRVAEQKKSESGQIEAAESRSEPETAASDPKPSRPKDNQAPEVRGAEGAKAAKASVDATAATVARVVAARDAEQAAARAPEPERQTAEQGARTVPASSDVKGDQMRHDAKDGFFGASTREKSAPVKSQTSGAGKIVPEGESAVQTAAQSAPSTASIRAEAATGVRNTAVYQQIENGAFKNLGQGLRQLVIRLDPADLGQVSVILQVRGKEVQAVLRAGSQETSQILNEQLGQLRTQLEAQGLKVGRLEVQTQLADSQSQSQWQGAEQHNRYQENRELALSAQRWRNLERLDADLARDVQNTPQREKLSQSALDIFA